MNAFHPSLNFIQKKVRISFALFVTVDFSKLLPKSNIASVTFGLVEQNFTSHQNEGNVQIMVSIFPNENNFSCINMVDIEVSNRTT